MGVPVTIDGAQRCKANRLPNGMEISTVVKGVHTGMSTVRSLPCWQDQKRGDEREAVRERDGTVRDGPAGA